MTLPGFNQVPTSIGPIRIHLEDWDGILANMRAFYDVDVLDQDGVTMRFPGSAGNLVPHLTQAQIDVLVNFMQEMRALAEQSFLS